jgi:hypothetical protein
LLAHIDALAEAGLSLSELPAFAEQAALEHPGALWVLTILFGCLDVSGAEEAFEAWVASLDPSLFLSYRGVLEIAEALPIQPNPLLRHCAQRWLTGRSVVLCAIAVETLSLSELSGDVLLRLAPMDSPLVQVAIERLLARSPGAGARATLRRASWIDLPAPALAYEVARARILGRDLEPLFRLRQGDAGAIGALGRYAVDVFALAGEGSDQDLLRDLIRGFPTTVDLLDAVGRVGLPALFPRLLAELENDDFDDGAHRALVTALGPRVPRPSMQPWEQVVAALAQTTETTRLRGGEPHALRSVLEEMKRSELSVKEVRMRADEVFVKAGKSTHVEWEAFGVSLEGALSALAPLAR